MQLTDADRTDLVDLRRDLHAHPELSFQEERTAGVVAEWLRDCGVDDVREGVAGTGVIGFLKGAEGGPNVLLRADMDALPVVEADRGQSYRSRVDGVHHACGHDGHVAILLVAARLLARDRTEVPGSVTFAFQPAEERVGGARPMLEDAALPAPPSATFGLHLWTPLPVGRVEAYPGAIFAGADLFALALEGSGGHGAMPHETRDPIVAAAELILALQTLVSREAPPLEPAVLTIGSLHAGSAPNIIPPRIELQGTLRTFDEGLRNRLIQRIRELTEGVAALSGLRAVLEVPNAEYCPPCVNDPRMAELVQEVAAEVVGPDRVGATARTMGGDDMAFFLRRAPGCYFFLGAANPARGIDAPHHSPSFDIDEAALPIGVEMLTGIVRRYLGSAGQVGH